MLKDKIKELKRPVGSDAYNINLANSIYNAAIDDVLKILEAQGEVNTLTISEAAGEVSLEVRKETAKEILNDLYFNLRSSVQGKVSKSNDYYNVLGWIEELAIEYGVEVEE